MPKLKEVYLGPKVAESHKSFIWEKVEALTRGKQGSRRELFDLLRVVYSHYDNGGHSCGRSRRSKLLESSMGILQKKRLLSKDRQELSETITMLVSMYHDDEYILEMGWYTDVDLEHALTSNVQERVHLMAVFELLGLTELTSERPQ
jgi:hypothetical protein